jgi:hypothetical protein
VGNLSGLSRFIQTIIKAHFKIYIMDEINVNNNGWTLLNMDENEQW